MSIAFDLAGALITPFLLFGAGYIGYWCYRGARYTWSGLTGRPIVRPAPALSPQWSKALHIVGVVASVAVVAVAALFVVVMIAFSQMSF